MRGSNYVKIEETLDHWLKSIMAYKNIALNCPLIQAQLKGFKKRHNITFKTIVGEAGLVDPTTIKNWLKVLSD